jgi:N6-adenosine-specific RNA methylase IME4
MRGVHCSWVDMENIRQALAGKARGDQVQLERLRCVDHSTVSTWRAVCDVLEAIQGKCSISNFSHFQPSHAAEIGRAFRRPGKTWPEETKEEIAGWVDRCEAEEWTVEQLRSAVAPCRNGTSPIQEDVRVVDGLEALIAAGESFGTIYADPPWKYANQATRAATSNHYPTHTADEIAALPVSEVAAENAHLHLWTTNAFIFESAKVLEAWGFEYKSMFVRVKPQMGIGNYWRVSHEILLLGVRGSCPFPEGQKYHRSWVEAARGLHSAKPKVVREIVEKVSPGPRLELFGRHEIDGWTVVGNQIQRSLSSGNGGMNHE